MFERFTPRARQVVVLAEDEVRALRHDAIGTEHLLLGLLDDSEGIAARVLATLGVTHDAVHAQVARIVSSAGAPAGQIPLTPRAKRVLEGAAEEATALDHPLVGTEHVLLGLVREADGVAVQILRDDLGVTPQTVRERVLDAFGA